MAFAPNVNVELKSWPETPETCTAVDVVLPVGPVMGMMAYPFWTVLPFDGAPNPDARTVDVPVP